MAAAKALICSGVAAGLAYLSLNSRLKGNSFSSKAEQEDRDKILVIDLSVCALGTELWGRVGNWKKMPFSLC